MSAHREKYTDEFKLNIVEMMQNGKNARDLAKQFNLSKTLPYYWKKAFDEGRLKRPEAEMKPEPKVKTNGVAKYVKATPGPVNFEEALAPFKLEPAPLPKPMQFLRTAPCPVCKEGMGWTIELETTTVCLCDRGGMSFTPKP